MEELLKKLMPKARILIEFDEKERKVEIEGAKLSVMFAIVDLLEELKKDNGLNDKDIDFMFETVKGKAKNGKEDNLMDDIIDKKSEKLAEKFVEMLFGKSND